MNAAGSRFEEWITPAFLLGRAEKDAGKCCELAHDDWSGASTGTEHLPTRLK